MSLNLRPDDILRALARLASPQGSTISMPDGTVFERAGVVDHVVSLPFGYDQGVITAAVGARWADEGLPLYRLSNTEISVRPMPAFPNPTWVITDVACDEATAQLRLRHHGGLSQTFGGPWLSLGEGIRLEAPIQIPSGLTLEVQIVDITVRTIRHVHLRGFLVRGWR